MDTALEIRRDRWISEHEDCCGTCLYLKWHRQGHRNYCSNEDSWEYGQWKEHNEGCSEYVRKWR